MSNASEEEIFLTAAISKCRNALFPLNGKKKSSDASFVMELISY